jgi:hypothetical protein
MLDSKRVGRADGRQAAYILEVAVVTKVANPRQAYTRHRLG